MKILLYGFGSEYVLDELERYLNSKNVDYIAINNPSTLDEKKIKEIISDEIIFITSSHLTLGYRNAIYIEPRFALDFKNTLSPLQLISIIKPLCKIFIPHDLQDPLGKKNTNEIPYFDIFDYIFLPKKIKDLDNFISQKKIIYNGWIKKNSLEINFPIDSFHTKCIYFPSNFYQIKDIGPELFEQKICSLKKDVVIKFPSWPGVDEFENYLNQKNYKIIDSSYNASKLIEKFDFIIVDSIGSIYKETLSVGKKIIFVDWLLSSNVKNNTFVIKLDDFKSFNLKKLNNSFKLNKTDRCKKNNLPLFSFDILFEIINRYR